MIPVVALVGRPNVGKSTLFNRLTRTRDALVADFPGLTRDRKYGRAEVEGREFICIDTGGIDGTEEGVETRMAEQSLLAIEEADVVLFMVDARAGLMPADIAIAKHLRSREKPTFLVANKTDGIDVDQAMADFWSLGLGDIYPIAASHGRGVTSLLEQALLPWVDEVNPQEEVDEDAEYWAKFEAEQNGEAEEEPEDDFNPQDLPIKLAIVGRPNVGKSTLTNRILGEDRVVVYDMPGTTRDSIYIPMKPGMLAAAMEMAIFSNELSARSVAPKLARRICSKNCGSMPSRTRRCASSRIASLTFCGCSLSPPAHRHATPGSWSNPPPKLPLMSPSS